jgi:hypothetical protein
MRFQDLLAYKKIIFINDEDFEITKSFQEETYSLTDQIRRSSKCSCYYG